MIYLFYFLVIIFLYLNIKIITSDLKIKKIPNKYLGYLLLLIPLWWFFLFLKPISGLNIYYNEINILLFLGQVILTLIVGFLLYYFGIWAAGDAKYLLVLSLFIPHIGVIPFIGNIGFITIIYLFLYFIYFYGTYFYFRKKNQYNISKGITTDFKRLFNLNNKNKIKNIIIILNNISFFLITFLFIRLLRIYFINSLIKRNSLDNIGNYLQKYNIYIILLFLIIYFLFLYGFKKLKNHLSKKHFFIKNTKYIKILIKSFLIILLIFFIHYEYIINPYNIILNIKIILSYSIIIYILFKILKYSYKIAFYKSEVKKIPLSKLKKGMIINMAYLKGRIKPDLFRDIEADIKTKKDLKKLKKILKKTGEIEIVDSFPFGIYIFIAFLITIIYSNLIYSFIIQKILSIVKSHF